jgi:hypothetical protein
MKRSDEPFTFIVSREWGCTQLRAFPEPGANYMPEERRINRKFVSASLHRNRKPKAESRKPKPKSSRVGAIRHIFIARVDNTSD